MGKKANEWQRILSLSPERREAERLRARLAARKYRENNRAKVTARQKQARALHPEREVFYKRKYTARASVRNNQHAKETYAKNRVRLNYLQSLRYHKKMSAIPPWANRSAMRLMYQIAREMSCSEGVKYTVDHIIPLNGKHVSGLHVETNMQIVPLTFNIKKRRRMMHELILGEFNV